MTRILPICDKSVTVIPPAAPSSAATGATLGGSPGQGGTPGPVVVPQNTVTNVLADMTTSRDGEIAARWIQNIGSNACNIAIDQDADNATNIHMILPANQSLPIDITCFGTKRVSAYCSVAGGTKIATIIARRVDMYTHAGIVPS